MLHSAPCFILVDVCRFDAYLLSAYSGKKEKKHWKNPMLLLLVGVARFELAAS